MTDATPCAQCGGLWTAAENAAGAHVCATRAVQRPPHYIRGAVECIDVIRAMLSPEQFQGYCRGNVVKYLWRFEQKGGAEDLRKAEVYLRWLRESLP